jgi:hypothetical protein
VAAFKTDNVYFGHDAFGFRNTIQARLAEMFLLGNGANRVDVLLDISGNELAVATHAAIEVDKVVGMADGTDALGDLFALPGEVLVLLTRGFHGLRSLLQTHGRLWGATGTALWRLAVDVGQERLPAVERLFSLYNGLVSRQLFGSHGGRDGLAQFMLYMEEVWRVMYPEVVFDI